VGTGCIVLTLPPVAVSPQLTMEWGGKVQAERRLRIAIGSDNAPARLFALEGACPPAAPGAPECSPTDGSSVRVAVQVEGRRGGATRRLYRALLRPDSRGDLHEVVRVPLRRRMGRICAEAAFVVGNAGFPGMTCPGRGRDPGRATAELRPIGGR